MKRIAFVGFLRKDFVRLASLVRELGHDPVYGGCMDDGSNCCRDSWTAAAGADFVLINKSFARYTGSGYGKGVKVVSVHGLSSAREWLRNHLK